VEVGARRVDVAGRSRVPTSAPAAGRPAPGPRSGPAGCQLAAGAAKKPRDLAGIDPGRSAEPIVAQLAEELDGTVKVGKLDIDESPVTAGKFGIRGVPTVMVFKNGERAAQHVGLTTKAKLKELVVG